MAGEKNRADPAITARLGETVAKLGRQSVVAKRVGVSQAGLSNWATGMVRPPFEAVARLAQEANVSLDWIATGEASGVFISRYAPDAVGNPVRQPPDADTLAVHADFFTVHRLDPAKTGIVRVTGDAMAPELPDGSLVIIDMRFSNFAGEGLWLLGRARAVFARRATFEGPVARLTANDRGYPDIVIDGGGDDAGYRIWGRIVMALTRK